MTNGQSNPAPQRNRIFSLVTLVMAVVCAFGTKYVADYVRHLNTARIVGAAMTGNLSRSEPPSQPTSSLSLEVTPRPNPIGLPALPLLPMPGSQANPQRTDNRSVGNLQRQTAYVEGIVLVWGWMMYGLAGGLALVGIISWLTHKARPLHLIAAGAIFITTVGTLLGIVFLGDLSKGGFKQVHPLPIRIYVYTAVVQSLYGVTLLVAFARKPKRPVVTMV